MGEVGEIMVCYVDIGLPQKVMFLSEFRMCCSVKSKQTKKYFQFTCELWLGQWSHVSLSSNSFQICIIESLGKAAYSETYNLCKDKL